ncbi:hypothetical protein JZ751_026160 [Albula glossodonta]|uniref:Uncharacterized protein n=1 Tax=Albula glossodonta TaxID=121402 RepID=A0A8T2PL64_9TELE|nr:hypothetical protein JZ751_026160 [Albula glossodonta]
MRASSSELGCHRATGPISAASWYCVRMRWSCTGLRVGWSNDSALQLNCKPTPSNNATKNVLLLTYRDEAFASAEDSLMGNTSTCDSTERAMQQFFFGEHGSRPVSGGKWRAGRREEGGLCESGSSLRLRDIASSGSVLL